MKIIQFHTKSFFFVRKSIFSYGNHSLLKKSLFFVWNSTIPYGNHSLSNEIIKIWRSKVFFLKGGGPNSVFPPKKTIQKRRSRLFCFFLGKPSLVPTLTNKKNHLPIRNWWFPSEVNDFHKKWLIFLQNTMISFKSGWFP